MVLCQAYKYDDFENARTVLYIMPAILVIFGIIVHSVIAIQSFAYM